MHLIFHSSFDSRLTVIAILSTKNPGSLPLEAVPDARDKINAGKGYVFQGWTRNARIAKIVSTSRKMGKTVLKNYCYNQSSSRAIIRGKGR